jgi:hypothetical protein
MVRDYEGRKQEINELEDSKKSLEIYEKAYACFRPECGESNAESAERHELIAAKIIELNRQRRGERKNQHRIQHHFETATGFTNVINNKQRRTTNTQGKYQQSRKHTVAGNESNNRNINRKVIHKQHSNARF